MDSFDKVNDGVNSNKCATDDNVRMNLMNQRSKTIDEWILKRKEAWKFQEELLVEDFENTDAAPPDPGNRFSTLETDGSQQGPTLETPRCFQSLEEIFWILINKITL
nr:uncharacterized protein LOC117690387 isoform X2 [Crassostrea gigas]